MYEEDYSFAKACMGPDEYVLWKGKPQEGNLLTGADAFMIPFGLLWCGFAVFWMVGVFSTGAPIFFLIFGSFFLFFGLYMVFGRFIWAAYIRRRTAYVITNRKIIRRRGSKIDVLAASTMPAARTEYHKDGSGTVYFQTMARVYRNGIGWQMNITGMNSGIFTIENVPEINRVLQAIESMKK